MDGDLQPLKAATLAQRIYLVNENRKEDLNIFLNNPLFSSARKSKQQLKAEVGGRVFRAAQDAFGLCAMGAGEFEGDLFLIFRGTTTANNNADFVTDARIGLSRTSSGLPVHCGFNHTFKSMLPSISKFIAERKISGRVHCIGHSLGGAVATLAADWLASSKKYSVSLYTFGQPRVGMMTFSTLCTHRIRAANIYRVFQTTDPVPMVPVFPYVHCPLPGNGLRLLSGQTILSGEAHKMKNYLGHFKNSTSWKDLRSAPPINTHEDAIKGWLKSKAEANSLCPDTFAWLERALIWLISKAVARAVYGLQLVAIGIHSFVDMAAYVLAKGIELGEAVSEYTKLFFKKAMKILGLKFREGVTNLTRSFMRYILLSIIQRVNQTAQRAIREIGNGR